MKITSIEIFDVKAPSPTFERIKWNPIIVRLNTDDGISGLGEVGLAAFATASTAAVGMVKSLAEQFLIGVDPMQTEMIWEALLRKSYWALGGGPVVYGGMSAIDTALMDIKGKALGVPVYQLLGGKTNDRLRSYASQIQGGWSPDAKLKLQVTLEEYSEIALKAVEDGYTAVKVDPVSCDAKGEPIPSLRGILPHELTSLFYKRVEAIRMAVGDKVDVLLEVHGSFNTTAAIQMGRLWEDLNCYFCEEPVDSLNVPSLQKVANNVKIPIAAGERIYTRWGYRPYLENRVIDIIQPDIGLVGGFTEAKKIADLAHIYDSTVQSHVCGTAVATAASLQLEAAIPNFGIHEHHVLALRPENRQVVKQELQPIDGFFDIPDDPGLGIELNDDYMKNFDCIVVA